MKRMIISIIIVLIVSTSIVGLVSYKRYSDKKQDEEKRKEEIKNAVVKIEYIDDLDIAFLQEIKVSDLIKSINGKIVNDYEIDTTIVGPVKVEYTYINDDNIKLDQEVEINIKDVTPPLIWVYETYTVQKGNKFEYENILCGDDYDDDIKCIIEGDYNEDVVGTYPLTIKAVDDSGNESVDHFTLKVIEPKPATNTPSNYTPKLIDFDYYVKKYKTKKTKIGIDVSEWQKDIDFDLLKDTGVEFIILRVGGSLGTDKDYFLDKTFTYNIEKANELGIDVGVYFFSYADSVDHAIRDAKWVVDQLKDYKIDLPVAFDWENWRYFNSYGVSFYELTCMANEFIKVVEDAGYTGMLYSSTEYLEHMWMPTKHLKWLAQYSEKPTYKGDFKYWQLTDRGQIDGIKGAVDINIMYLD